MYSLNSMGGIGTLGNSYATGYGSLIVVVIIIVVVFIIFIPIWFKNFNSFFVVLSASIISGLFAWYFQ
ncbi:hypothetical protein MNBD_GAMMA12-3910 [hydrothermal vent metagenome]|uniref:Uncharacterized protein n=1 Tax=hydrothermal vent metagenome TaxID=652676 RepID=A0A3B0XSM0_9ZZZZ